MERGLYVNLIGQAGAGKGTVATHLAQSYGFTVFRPSDVIRAYAAANDIPLRQRKDYLDVHRALQTEDPQAVTRQVLAIAGNVCIDGLRVPAYVHELREHCGLYTIALDCPLEVRFARIMAAREWRQYRDASQIDTLAAFVIDEAIDNTYAHPYEPNVAAVMATADTTIDANRPRECVWKDVDAAILARAMLSD